MAVRIVGVDCATDDEKVGVALGEVEGGHVTVLDVRVCSLEARAARVIGDWLTPPDGGRALVAIDAPLGWPAALGTTLSAHKAGMVVGVHPNTLFRRETDRFVQRKLKKTPLDVGADRIARTAHAALAMLADLRVQLGIDLPLAWDDKWEGIAAIEVYPAATLLARGLQAKGYKKKQRIAERLSLRNALEPHIRLPADPCLVENADALDAAVCVLAGADFVRGNVEPPYDRGLAAQEGWIWFGIEAQASCQG